MSISNIGLDWRFYFRIFSMLMIVRIGTGSILYIFSREYDGVGASQFKMQQAYVEARTSMGCAGLEYLVVAAEGVSSKKLGHLV